MILENATIQVGEVRIDALFDMPLDIDREMVYPKVAAEEWAGMEDYLSSEGKVRLEIVCYLIRSQGRTLLCDTGMGVARGTDQPGTLLEDLGSAGVKPEDIDAVIFTHLHPDHIGWNIDWSGEKPKATFPNAKYVIQRAEWDASTTAERRENPPAQRQLLPLEALGQLELISGSHSFTDEVSAIDTSGHTPGHMSFEISSGGERALVQGDLVVHHTLLPRPGWEPRFDQDQETARELRDRELSRWAKEQLLIIANHFPTPGYGYVEKDGDGWRWIPLM